MQDSRAQEQFSFAYITAVASQARIQVELRRLDDDGIDGELISDQGTEPRIDFQAKSTSEDIEHLDHISYPLKVDNYARLIRKTSAPRILIVTIVPPEPEQWLDQNTERLVARRCAYWEILKGRGPTSNIRTVAINIPKSQIFSPETLTELMQMTDAGDLDD